MKSIFVCFLLTFLSFNCSKVSSQDPVPEHQTIKIFSNQLKEERVINIWLPDSYKNSTEKFPVLYMLDGGVQEDFPHLANTVAKLIEEKKIKPLILVGIENTERRRDLTGFTTVAKDKKIAPVVGGSEKFRSFITTELFPKIEKDFRTDGEKGIIGESVAGLFVTETLLLHPEIFDAYIAFDPSLWWNNHYLVKTASQNLSKFPQKNIKFWFAGSGAKDISLHTRNLEKALRVQNNPNFKWHYSDEPGEKHNTIFRATKEQALIWTFSQ